MRLSRTHLVLSAWLIATRVFAADVFYNGIPIHNVFPTPSGIIYPSLLTAGGINPAGLPQKAKRVKAMSLTYSPAPSGDQTHDFGLAYAFADKTKGLGFGYHGSIRDRYQQGLYVGGAFRSESTSIGIGLRDSDLSNGLNPETDLGILAGTGTDLTLGLVFYRLQSAPQIDVGIGFSNDKTYSFELNLLLPPVGTVFQSGSEYIFTAATTVYSSIFGLSFSSSYSTKTSDVTQTVAVLINIMKRLSLTVQYRSPQRSYYGLILQF